jgi:hypothetical protein
MTCEFLSFLVSSLKRVLVRTLCFSRSSLLRGALMMVLRTLEGAPKWSLRDLRLDEARPEESMLGQLLDTRY